MKKKRVLALLFLILMALPVPAKATIHAEEELIDMGMFKITYYCSCEECSGNWGILTATGNHCVSGRTCAVDPSVISYGTRILIDGDILYAEDCGSGVKGDHIDIYVDDHETVERGGVRYKHIWLVK